MSLFSQKPAGPAAAQPSLFGSNTSTLQSNTSASPFAPAAPAANSTATTFGSASNAGSAANSATSTSSNTKASFGAAPGTAPALPAQITPGASSGRILKDLVDSAHNLPKLRHGSIEPLHFTLAELRSETDQRRKRESSGSGSRSHTQAHYLLSRSGVNAADFEHALAALPGPHAGDEEAASVVHVRSENSGSSEGIDGYLTARKDETIWHAIESSLASASRDFDKYVGQSVTVDWKVRKDALKKSLGLPVRSKASAEQLAQAFSWKTAVPGTDRLLAPLPAPHKSSHAGNLSPNVNAASSTATSASSALGLGSASARHVPREKFEATAKVVYELNESRMAGRPYALCARLEALCKPHADSRSRQMAEIWRVLASLTGEDGARVSQEQLFYAQYAHADPTDPAASTASNDGTGAGIAAFRKTIVSTAKSALETQFFAYCDEIYAKDERRHTQTAESGTSVDKVMYFIRRVIARNQHPAALDRTLNYNGVPVWALVFYLMRSGLYAEASEFANANTAAFSKFDRNFPAYMAQFAASGGFGMPSESQERIAADYAQNFQFIAEDAATFDPYKYAVYKILGKCDLVRKNVPAALNLSVEDWVWFHMSLLSEFAVSAAAPSDLLYENYRLENLQRKVLASGPARFNASSNHPAYARTLVMLGLYERAVHYVYEHIGECDAVHLALALAYYGLLRTTNAPGDELLVIDSTAGATCRINFSRLLGAYTHTFKLSDPKVAAQYLLTICVANGGRDAAQTARCHEAVRELVAVSREFALLLGDVDPVSGDKTPGLLERQRALLNLPELRDFYLQITERCARRCEDEGRVFDAVRLYQLCNEHDTAVQLLGRSLGELLALTPLDKPLGETETDAAHETNVVALSRTLRDVFERNSNIAARISSREKHVLDMLLAVVDVRDSFARRDWQRALDGVQEAGLVPVTASDDFVGVRRAAEALEGLDAKLVKVVPSVLTVAMTCVAQLCREARARQFGIPAHERAELDRLRAVAKNCMVFAGMIQYKMPRETYSSLVNLEASL